MYTLKFYHLKAIDWIDAYIPYIPAIDYTLESLSLLPVLLFHVFIVNVFIEK